MRFFSVLTEISINHEEFLNLIKFVFGRCVEWICGSVYTERSVQQARFQVKHRFANSLRPYG